MDTTNTIALTGALTVVGTWSKGDKLNIRMFVGFAVLLVMLSVLSEVNAKLANGFGILVLITAALLYVPAIVNKLGFSNG